MVVRPDAGQDPVCHHLFQSSIHRGLGCPQAGRAASPVTQQLLSLLGDTFHQGFEGFGKSGYAIVLELLRDGLQVYAQLGQAGQLIAGLVKAGFQGRRHGAMIQKGIEG